MLLHRMADQASSTYQPACPHFSRVEMESLQVEIEQMILKGALSPIKPGMEDGFLSSIFLIPKKDEGHRPMKPGMEDGFLSSIFGDGFEKTMKEHVPALRTIRRTSKISSCFKCRDECFKFYCLPFGLARPPRPSPEP